MRQKRSIKSKMILGKWKDGIFIIRIGKDCGYRSFFREDQNVVFGHVKSELPNQNRNVETAVEFESRGQETGLV